MGFLSGLFRKEQPKAPLAEPEPEEAVFRNEPIPGTLDLGWYYSPNKDELQMAKIAQEDRATHLYVIGATGSGKTKFLEFLIKQDIEKGPGFGVIDPHGDLIEDIKGLLVCHHHEHRYDKDVFRHVVVIDPSDPKYTVTFNPLERLPNVPVAEQAGELVASFRKIWSDSWGARMEDLMRNSLIALAEAELTLVELPAFLTRRAYRQRVLERVNHPVAREYFQRFDALTDRAQITWIEPVMNKINAFLSDQRIGQMFSGPKSSFNFREVIDHSQILLVKLDKGRLKDSADLLGSLIMAKIKLAAFSRSDRPQSKRTPFYLYVDEFQNFATESFATVLSEARKYGLSLTMAHQTLAQIPIELRSLILGNAGIQVYFRVNRQDSQLLAKEAFEYSGYEVKTVARLRPVFWSYSEEWEHKTEELQNLPPRACWVKHKIEGGVIPLNTVYLEPAWEALGMKEDAYYDYLETFPFGMKYLVPREKLARLAEQRQGLAQRQIEPPPTADKKRAQATSAPAREKPKAEKPKEEKPKTEKERPQEPKAESPKQEKQKEQPVAREPAVRGTEKARPKLPRLGGKGGPKHKYLQALIKRMAEESGYRAIIEQSTPDGQGKVDVGLQLDGKRFACEISVTSTDEQELSNIEKCLLAGYDQVLLCSPEKKVLEKVRALVSQSLNETDRDRVLFFQPEDLILYLEEIAAGLARKEEKIKGYTVKVQYQPVGEDEKRAKREAIAKVILQALRRMKEEK